MNIKKLEVGDTVWFIDNYDNRDYSRTHFGGIMGPFVITVIRKPYDKWVADLADPQGETYSSGAYLTRLRKDVFLCAVKEALKHAS